jgi:hypothetical protein
MADVFIHVRRQIPGVQSLDSSNCISDKIDPRIRPVIELNDWITTNDDDMRIVCISDTHNQHRLISNMPEGDILIHSGDFTNTGEYDQILDFIEWMHEQPYKIKIFIAGNHDLTIHSSYYERTGRDRFHGHLKRRNITYDPVLCREALIKYSDVIYLEDSSITLQLGRDTKPIVVYGSPWQPEFFDWAFNLNRGAEILEKWQRITEDVDILITHGPPFGYGDKCENGIPAGCIDLLNEIRDRIHPKLHVFGHIHEDVGVWTLTNKGGKGISLLVNASTCTYNYTPTNPPIVIKFPFDESKNAEQFK